MKMDGRSFRPQKSSTMIYMLFFVDPIKVSTKIIFKTLPLMTLRFEECLIKKGKRRKVFNHVC
jgi:hypothetical protein